MKINNLKINSLLYVFKTVLGVVFPLITFPYISRTLGVDNVGIYNFAQSIISYLVLIASLGISSYAVREGSKYREDKQKLEEFINQVFSINVISTGVAYVLLLIIIFIPSMEQYRSIVFVLSFQIILNTIGFDWIFNIEESFLYITIRSLASKVIGLVLLFTFVHSRNDLIIYAIITVIAGFGLNVINYVQVIKKYDIQLVHVISTRQHIRPILLLFAASITVTIYVNCDKTMLGIMAGDYSVGIYSTAVNVYAVVKSILSSVYVVAIPRISALIGRGLIIDTEKLLDKIYKTVLTFVIPCILGIIVLRREIIIIISSSDFVKATIPLLILSAALIFNIGSCFWRDCVLVTFREDNIILRNSVFSAVINIILNLCLIPRFHEIAAAITTLIAEVVAFLLNRHASLKHIKVIVSPAFFVKIGIGVLVIPISAFCMQSYQSDIYLYTALVMLSSFVFYLIAEIILKNEVMYSIVMQSVKYLRKFT